MNPLTPAFNDPSLYGTSNMSNIPFGNLRYSRVNSIGRQWVRQYTIALSKELLGLIRSKFSSIPIPNAELQLNGGDLVSAGKEEKDKLMTQLKEMLDTMTYDKLLEMQAAKVDNLQKVLRAIPIPVGRAISIG